MIARTVIAFLALAGFFFLTFKVAGRLRYLTLGQLVELAVFVTLILVSAALAGLAVYSIIHLETLF